ncbi:MAG: SAM-dependent DNA methyltransferase, partial [bacterium]|nr:SAM-dependent DNA methyltransferase [bacterium]
YNELLARDKVSLDIFWLRDDSLTDTDDLPPPAVLAAEIAEDIQAALEEIQALADSLTTSERTTDPGSN